MTSALVRSSWLALAALSGCGAPPAATDTTPAQVRAPVVIDSAQRPDSPAAHPAAGSCRVTDDHLDVPVPMRLRRGGPVIATWQEPSDVVLALGASGESAPLLEASGAGITLRTPWDPAVLPLTLRHAVALEGIVTPLAHRSVEWLASVDGSARIRYEAGPAFDQLVLEDEIECGLLALHRAAYEPQDAGAPAPVASQAYLKPDIDIDVRAVPQGPVVARVKLRNLGEGAVTIHGRSGGLVDIRYETDDEVLMGWVSSGALADRPPELSGISGAGSGGMGAGVAMRMKSPMSWIRCDRNVEIHAEAGGERAVVGMLTKDGRFEAGAHRDGWVVIDFWTPWIVPGDGAFLVREEDFGHCTPDAGVAANRAVPGGRARRP